MERGRTSLAVAGMVALIGSAVMVILGAAGEGSEPLSACDNLALCHPELPFDVTLVDSEVTWLPLGLVCTWSAGGQIFETVKADWPQSVLAYGAGVAGIGCLIASVSSSPKVARRGE